MPRWAWSITSPSVGVLRLASSTALRLDHKPSTAFELWCVGGQALDHQPGSLRGKPVAHGAAAMGWQAVPQQRGLLPAEESAQPAQDLDQALGVVVASGDVEAQLGATTAHAVAQRRRHRRLLPVERVDQHRRLAAWRPGAAHLGRQAEGAFVEEDQAGSAPLGACLIRGQSFLTHWSIAAWSRSAARRLGRCTGQPSRWRSNAQTCAG